MTRNLALPLLAVAGLAVAVVAVVRDNEAAPAIGAPSPTATAPFISYVEGTGITEASTGNIAIGTPVSGIITKIDVSWGEQVAAGAPPVHHRRPRRQGAAAAGRSESETGRSRSR
jgi:multidrug efflux pump subunit AcrA (membrane-fusion protein)